MIELTWTVKYYHTVTTDEIKDMVKYAKKNLRLGCSFDEAVSDAVKDYLSGQEDDVYYTITDEATEKIEAVVAQRLKKFTQN